MARTRPLIGDPVPVNLQGKALVFVQAMAKGKDWETAGEEAKLTRQSARQYRYKYRSVIMDLVGERQIEGSALAVNTLLELMRNGDSESVRLGAARDWLDRFGAPAVRRVVLDVQSSPDAALRAYLLEALGSPEAVEALMAAMRPQALTGVIPAPQERPALEHEA